MRPIDRGPCPTDEGGAPKKFHPYTKAQKDIINRLGEYCSYCERPLSNVAIEHLLPKKWYPHCQEEWDNFLPTCPNCNGIKGSTMQKRWKFQEGESLPNEKTILALYYWPDRDNTASIFKYREGGIIELNSCLNQSQKRKAQITLELTGLERHERNIEQPPTDKDLRWIKRSEVWDIAIQYFKLLKENKVTRETVIDVAKPRGFLSVWMTVFWEDPEMLKQLIEAFPGTRQDCFDDLGHPIPLQESPPKPVENPSLRQESRYKIADVLPRSQEPSILDWLEASGRLMSREEREFDYAIDEEEIAALMSVEDFIDDDDDDELVEEN
ncbi:DUF3134 family protein [Laspinema olomoucense]|uniref:DUF3134 family protein n=1 Tax=Laspinema olomoucense TaxID=3231600 RepID=UPI0021BAC0FC|nr:MULTISPECIES: DUF3134 family protein [unclassified Laspinema]MCT7970537.1 DUF3134 family protein [Laspinema sp. D3d]MCT7991663.1 DUF3134 family protein [Laspinema sp. D3a]